LNDSDIGRSTPYRDAIVIGGGLPTLGSQNYSVTFRFYGPRGGVADGSYYPPPLIKRTK